MVINTLAIFLFLDREMHLTAALHGAYLVISVFGWRNWFVDYHRQRSMLFPYLEARHWTAADFACSEQIQRLWPLVEQLGELTIDRPRRCYADDLRHYWQQVEAVDATEGPLKARWRAFEPEVEAFDQAAWSARLVHHDLIPENVLDTGDKLVLIDWEYAAPGHPDIDRWSIDPGSIDEPSDRGRAGSGPGPGQPEQSVPFRWHGRAGPGNDRWPGSVRKQQ